MFIIQATASTMTSSKARQIRAYFISLTILKKNLSVQTKRRTLCATGLKDGRIQAMQGNIRLELKCLASYFKV